MIEQALGDAERLSRRQASDAVTGLGWRYVLGTVRTSVRVGSLAQAAEVAARAVGVAGGEADRHLWLDLRPDRVVLTLQTLAERTVTAPDAALAGRDHRGGGRARAADRPGRRRGRRAVGAAAGDRDRRAGHPGGPPVLEGGPRSVPHDEAPGRLVAALAAGGRLVSDAAAPAFWVLADAEGNEACITTWQGREP